MQGPAHQKPAASTCETCVERSCRVHLEMDVATVMVLQGFQRHVKALGGLLWAESRPPYSSIRDVSAGTTRTAPTLASFRRSCTQLGSVVGGRGVIQWGRNAALSHVVFAVVSRTRLTNGRARRPPRAVAERNTQRAPPHLPAGARPASFALSRRTSQPKAASPFAPYLQHSQAVMAPGSAFHGAAPGL